MLCSHTVVQSSLRLYNNIFMIYMYNDNSLNNNNIVYYYSTYYYYYSYRHLHRNYYTGIIYFYSIALRGLGSYIHSTYILLCILYSACFNYYYYSYYLFTFSCKVRCSYNCVTPLGIIYIKKNKNISDRKTMHSVITYMI